MNIAIILIFFLFLEQAATSNTNSRERMCISPEGKKVDWYILFLFPKKIDPDYLSNFAYYDNTMTKFQYYKYDEEIFPPTKLTKMVLKDQSSINYFFWNCDPSVIDGNTESSPNEKKHKAHSKGTLAIDDTNAVFLSHSLPRFPVRNKDNEVFTFLPTNAGWYGQHFFCISTTAKQGNELARLLNYIDASNNKSVKKDQVNNPPNEWIEKLIKNEFDESYPLEEINTIKSLNGKEFTVITKSPLNRIVPYTTTLRQIYKDHFYIRSYPLPELYDSQCDDDYELLNILKVNFDDKFKFENKLEQAKWAVSKNKNIVCFGDLNYIKNHIVRGGNTFCFEDETLANNLRGFIQYHEECSYSNNFLKWLSS